MGTIFSSYGRTDWPIDQVKASVGPGWSEIIEDLVDELFELGWNGELAQIKEKFGGLRFYIGEGSKEVHDRIQYAEDLSFRTCESCGEPGHPAANPYNWIKTYCDECRERFVRESITQ